MMGTSMRQLLLAAAALLCGAAIAAAQESPTQDSEAPPPQESMGIMPAPPPGPAFPDIAETDMRAFCTRARRSGPFYPSRALDREVEGRVLLDCVMDVEESQLSTCQVIEETPADYGFGAAATRIACNFRIVVSTFEDNATLRGNLPPGSAIYRRNAEGEPWRARIPISFRLQ
jgi:hypothetical protein